MSRPPESGALRLVRANSDNRISPTPVERERVEEKLFMEPSTTLEFGMQFECCMRRVFGDDADHIASGCLNGEYRSEWVLRLLKTLIRDAQEIDTAQRHRENISHLLEACLADTWYTDKPSWHVVFQLLMLVTDLMGYAGVRGERVYTPMYWKDLKTHLDMGNSRGKADELCAEFASAARTRIEVVKFLKDKGLSDFEVAMALKTSECEIKKLKKAL